VVVCPVDCFYEGENMLVIDPDACIDCGVCVPECPAEAIVPEAPEFIDWLELNKKYAKQWPNINKKKDPLPEAKQFDGIPNKLTEHFSSNAAKTETKLINKFDLNNV
jgi:ferredoxin